MIYKAVKNTYRHYRNRLLAPLLPEKASIKNFHNCGHGKRCFIMGNGPSLKKINPDPLKKEITIGTNGIFLIKDWLGFLPTYHVTEDRLVVEDRGSEISEMKGPIKLYDKRWNKMIEPDDRTFNPRICYDYNNYPDFPYFSRNASKLLWVGGTVSYLCIQLAFYMGFDPVVLIGFDHSYSKPQHVKTQGNVWTSHGNDPNHIHPDYFGKGYRWHDPNVERMEKSYIRSKKEFDKANRKIFNATIGGELEVFERVNYSSLFQ